MITHFRLLLVASLGWAVLGGMYSVIMHPLAPKSQTPIRGEPFSTRKADRGLHHVPPHPNCCQRFGLADPPPESRGETRRRGHYETVLSAARPCRALFHLAFQYRLHLRC